MLANSISLGIELYEYLKYALYYNEQYGLAVAFKAVTGVPLHDWRKYAETGMDSKTITELFYKHVASRGRQAVRLAVLTGPYMANIENPMLVIDIDEPPIDNDKEKKLELMKAFAREGYQVVNTPRGFHLHVLLPKNEPLPYMITFYRDDDEKPKTIGEGGCLFPHPWSTVPSMRPKKDGNGWLRYSFVLPSGKKVASYKEFLLHRHEIEPATMRLNDVIEDVSFLLSAKVIKYMPKEGGTARPKIVPDGREITRKRPIFTDFEEFYASLLSTMLPTCVAWVAYWYAEEIGDELTASSIGSYLQELIGDIRKVPHGMRFLVSAAVSLFLAHVIEWIKFDEILNFIAPAIEDWPEDDGTTLDKKLSYLFLESEDGYVYPRYGGLGSLTPTQVWNCTEICVVGKMCKGRNPWRPFERLVKRKMISKSIYLGVEEDVEE